MIFAIFTILVIFILTILSFFIDISPVPIPIQPILFLFSFIVIVAFVHKIRKQCKTYGIKNVFRMSYTGKNIELYDYVYQILGEIPGIHTLRKWGNTILFFNPTGIYIFSCFKYKGLVTGNPSDEILSCIFGKQERRVKNPLLELNAKKEQLEAYLNSPVIPYLVIENHCQFFIKEIETIFLKNVYYHMIRNHEKVYTEEEIQQYTKKLDSVCQKVSIKPESLETK